LGSFVFWHDAGIMKWEYKIVSDSMAQRITGELLNKMGEDHWELIAIHFYDDSGINEAVFKRPKE
jgi:hypothetical protein